MPWKLSEDGKCVHKENADGSLGEVVKCHATHAEATDHMRALYASEKPAMMNTAILFSNSFREEASNGISYLVVTGIPLREQVMNTYLVPADEIVKSTPSWNGTAISIDHPRLNNGSVNVPDPDVAIIGRFYNARWDPSGRRMVGEYWIDINEANKYMQGQAIINAIRSGKMIETSTGYYAEDDPTPGTFNGRKYETVHRNLIRDHIAVLTREIGACSVSDGCGVNRNTSVIQNCAENCPLKKNSEMPSYQKDHLPRMMIEGYSFNKGSRTAEQLDSLRAHIAEKGIDKPVMVMRMNDGEIKIIDGNHRVSMAGEFGIDQIPVKVINENLMPMDPEMLYMEWAHKQDQSYLKSNRESRPTQTTAVSNLEQKEHSMKLPELLSFLQGKGFKVKANTEASEFEVEEPTTTPVPAPVTNANIPSLSADEIEALKSLAGVGAVLNSIGADGLEALKEIGTLKTFVANAAAQQKAERAQLIATIKTNTSNFFSDAELEAMPTSALAKINGQADIDYGPMGINSRDMFLNSGESLGLPVSLMGQVKQEK